MPQSRVYYFLLSFFLNLACPCLRLHNLQKKIELVSMESRVRFKGKWREKKVAEKEKKSLEARKKTVIASGMRGDLTSKDDSSM